MFPRKLLAALFAVTCLATTAFSQEPSPTTATPATNQRDQRPGRFGFRPRTLRRQGERKLSRLGLTDEQRTQIRAARQRQFDATKGQREEMFRLREKRKAGTFSSEDQARARQLRQELRNSMLEIRKQNYSQLTTEQRTQIDAFREQRQQIRGDMLRRRQEIRQNRRPMKTEHNYAGIADSANGARICSRHFCCTQSLILHRPSGRARAVAESLKPFSIVSPPPHSL